MRASIHDCGWNRLQGRLEQCEEKNLGGIMFGLGMQELVIILVIALLIFGPTKLPQIGSGLGKAIRDFRKGVSSDDPEDATKEANKETSKDLPQ
jgi:sec-independent protein translocase protein TatA